MSRRLVQTTVLFPEQQISSARDACAHILFLSTVLSHFEGLSRGLTMHIQTTSTEYDVFSPQFAFLSLQLLKSRPKGHRHGSHANLLNTPSHPTHRPVSLSFPSEILHIIFSFAVQPSSDDIDLAEKETHRATVLALVQVCQQWRLAARDCPELWVHSIDSKRDAPETVAELLRLSRSHLIDVGHRSAPFRVANSRDLDVFRLFRLECRRIREWNLDRPLAHLISNRIQSDSFIFPVDQPSLTVIRSTGRSVCLLSQLSKFSPTLKKVSIRDLRSPLPFNSSLTLSHLTELAVANVALHVRVAEAFWLQLLSGTPQLKLLALHDATLLDPIWHPYGEVDLPHLRLLSLRESDWQGVRAMRRLLSCLHLPRTCGVDLKLPPIPHLPTSRVLLEIRRLRRILRHHLGRPTSRGRTSADIPQVHFGVRTAALGQCVAVIGTVQDPDSTFDWNGQTGTNGVMAYLDEHQAMSPRFPPLSISLDKPSSIDFDLLFLLAQPLLQEAMHLRIHPDASTPIPSAGISRIHSSLVTLMPNLISFLLA